MRVLNPTSEGIDGFVLGQTPGRNKTYPYTPGSDYNYGGITDSVELLLVPAVRVEDLFVRPDPKTGRIRVQANRAQRGRKRPSRAGCAFAVAPAADGETLDAAERRSRTAAGRHADRGRAERRPVPGSGN